MKRAEAASLSSCAFFGAILLLKHWTRSAETLPQEGGRTQHRLRWVDPTTGLELRVVAVEYADYPVVEWTGYLKNTAAADTPLLGELRAIDVLFGQHRQPATLRTIRGDNCSAESYEPLALAMGEQSRDFAAVGGRPTNGAYGTGVTCEDLYSVRSHWCPALAMGTYQEHWELLKQRLAEYRQSADYFSGDYYPLLPYSRARDVWMAWEFVRPEQGDGMLQVFRREESPAPTACLPLRGLQAESRYRLTDLDSGQSWEQSGQELMAPGLRLEMPSPRSAKILTFQEVSWSDDL